MFCPLPLSLYLLKFSSSSPLLFWLYFFFWTSPGTCWNQPTRSSFANAAFSDLVLVVQNGGNWPTLRIRNASLPLLSNSPDHILPVVTHLGAQHPGSSLPFFFRFFAQLFPPPGMTLPLHFSIPNAFWSLTHRITSSERLSLTIYSLVTTSTILISWIGLSKSNPKNVKTWFSCS